MIPAHNIVDKVLNKLSSVERVQVLRPPQAITFSDLFSSGMCTAIICSGSRHWTTQPCLSLTLAVSTLRKVFGIRLQSTDTMVCTSRRGGHCGAGFLCSLLNIADERGIASWQRKNILVSWLTESDILSIFTCTVINSNMRKRSSTFYPTFLTAFYCLAVNVTVTHQLEELSPWPDPGINPLISELIQSHTKQSQSYFGANCQMYGIKT